MLSLFMFSSCVTQKRCNIKYPPQIVDSTVIKYRDRDIVIHDTVNILIKGDSVSQTTQNDTSYLETERSSSLAIVNSLGLHHSLTDKPIDIERPIEIKWKVRDTIIYKYKKESYPVERELTQWQILQMWGGRILGLLILLFAAMKLLKKTVL